MHLVAHLFDPSRKGNGLVDTDGGIQKGRQTGPTSSSHQVDPHSPRGPTRQDPCSHPTRCSPFPRGPDRQDPRPCSTRCVPLPEGIQGRRHYGRREHESDEVRTPFDFAVETR